MTNIVATTNAADHPGLGLSKSSWKLRHPPIPSLPSARIMVNEFYTYGGDLELGSIGFGLHLAEKILFCRPVFA